MLSALKFPEIRKKVFFTLLIIVVFRLLSHVPVPGVDLVAVRQFLSSSAFFGLFNLFSGGSFANFSIITLGVAPYINVSIVMQLLTMMVPSLEELSKEGEFGREKINTYTILLTIPMALIQSYGIYFLLNKQNVLARLTSFDLVVLMLSMTAGSMFLIWLGELITEFGVGNGISLIIFVGIIGSLPLALVSFFTTLSNYDLGTILIFIVISLLVIVGVVLVNEGTRNITIEYGRRGVRSEKITNYLPIKVNQAGVIPIIFAVSVVLIPSLIAGPLQASSVKGLQAIGSFLFLNFNSNSILYNITYFLLVVGFTYFYTSIQFNSEKIAEDIKKRGGFIPGIRPGKSTQLYLKNIVNKITLAGALFLGAIAILPFLVQSYIGIGSLSIGGTGLLIVVSVVLETIRQLDSMSVTRNYESFLN